jgi:Txe/YoeB family toxin of Txe-Axe toxin-antitoxin module
MNQVCVLPLNSKLILKAQKLGIKKKLEKAISLFENNPFHPSLNTELLETKKMGIYSFRIDRKVRALFFFRKDKRAAEILNITVHYR